MTEEKQEQSELPEGWAETRIGDICDLINGRAFKPSEWASNGLPIIRIQNLNDPKAEFNYCNFEVEEKYLVDNGQLLFAWSGTPGTSFGAHIWNRGKAVLNQHIFKVNINEDYFDKTFLKHLLNRNVNEYIGKAHGTAGLAHITKGKFEESRMLLSPFNEQRRIASKVEELFSFLDAGVDSLRKVHAQLKRYRQAVLKYAFEGKLTEEWRKTHKDHTEPAQKLLEQIINERRIDLKYREQSPIDMSELPEVPENWMWTRIGDLFDVGSGGTPSRRKPEYWKGNIPWVSSGEVAFCEIKGTNECITKEGLENSSAKFYPAGTILMALYGEGKTRGQAAIMRITGTTNQAVACIVCANSPIPSEYVYWWLFYRYYETRRIREGANQPNMYLHHVRKMAIPVAPLSEQKEIIQKIEESLSVADEIDRTMDSSLSQAERLRRCILKTAFEGGLVSQDPSDEPAEKLLERIKAERAKSEGEKDTNKNKNNSRQLELSSYVK